MPTLIDGREVASDSPEWRLECLARCVLDLPSNRGAWMEDFEKRHGEAAAAGLAAVVRAVRQQRIERAQAAQAALRAMVTAHKEAA
jgi:hypothetical protein